MKAHKKRNETTQGEMLRFMMSTPTAKSNTLSQMLDSDSLPCYTASTRSEQAHARLRDCNQTTIDAYRSDLKSEQAHARLRDCNSYLPTQLSAVEQEDRTDPRPS